MRLAHGGVAEQFAQSRTFGIATHERVQQYFAGATRNTRCRRNGVAPTALRTVQRVVGRTKQRFELVSVQRRTGCAN